MGDKGSKDKGKKEAQKKAQRSPKEKRKLQKEKKNVNTAWVALAKLSSVGATGSASTIRRFCKKPVHRLSAGGGAEH